jgi:tRNA pseudouridine55 synthase
MLVHSAPAQDYLLPIEAALDDIPAVPVSDSQASLLRHGQPVRVIPAERVADGDTVIAMADGMLVALARFENGTIRPTRVINP